MIRFNSLSVVCLLLFLFGACSRPVVYYFNSDSGDDANPGTDSLHAFKSLSMVEMIPIKAGDQILLHAGSQFSEPLRIQCRGRKGRAVIVGKYGGSALPHIRVDGNDSVAVHLRNCEWITVRDLEVSNSGTEPMAGRKGVYVELENYGVAKETRIENLYIHDIMGSNTISEGGGTAIAIRNGRDSDTLRNRFEGLAVSGCTIRNCQRDGIKLNGYWIRSQWFPNLDVVIRGNTLDGVPGDGIMVSGCDGAIIEYNTMRDCPASLPPSEACDGIWPWCSDNTIVQFNVVSDHKSVIDAYAYDSDWGCRNSTFQYNLSYNNDGGFLLVIGTDGWPEDWCVNGNIGTIVRYNVSINDGLRNYMTDASGHLEYFCPVVNFTGFTKDNVLENNIFYSFPKPSPIIDKTFIRFTRHDGAYGKGDYFKNNRFFVQEPTIAVIEESATGNVFEGNRHVGPLETPESGFSRIDSAFGKDIWYDPNDPNWDILWDFLEDKEMPVNGEMKRVLDIIAL